MAVFPDGECQHFSLYLSCIVLDNSLSTNNFAEHCDFTLGLCLLPDITYAMLVELCLIKLSLI